MFSVDTCAVMAKPGIILDHTTENGFGTRGGGAAAAAAGAGGTGTGTGASGGGNGDDMMIVYML